MVEVETLLAGTDVGEADKLPVAVAPPRSRSPYRTGCRPGR